MTLRDRFRKIDAVDLEGSLDERGFIRLPPLVSAAECRQLIRLYDDDSLFRSHVVMQRHRFGEGEYKYFRDPLPPLVSTLREELYLRLVPVANRWRARLGEPALPPTLDQFREYCAARGQRQPTPLLLAYETGGYNRLHQDLYGEVAFPLQVVFLLSRPEVDFTGGANVFTEQLPRMQSRAHAVSLRRGEGIVFPSAFRPVQSARGFSQARFRHGLATVDTGRRLALGIIFHDAK